MPWQFEDPKHPDEPYDPENGEAHGLVGALVLRADRRLGQVHGVLLFGDDGRQRDEVRNDGNDVYDVHHVSEEVQLVGTREEAHGQLEREPYDAYRFYEEERVGDVGHLVLLDLGPVRRRVEHFVVLKLRQCLQTEYHYGQQDNEHGDDGNHSGRLRTLRVLKQQPHFALILVARQRFFFFFYETFVLAVVGKSNGINSMFVFLYGVCVSKGGRSGNWKRVGRIREVVFEEYTASTGDVFMKVRNHFNTSCIFEIVHVKHFTRFTWNST